MDGCAPDVLLGVLLAVGVEWSIHVGAGAHCVVSSDDRCVVAGDWLGVMEALLCPVSVLSSCVVTVCGWAIG